MPQTSINIRMDEQLKNDFTLLTGRLGLSMSAAITLFAKTAVREQRIPFPLELRPRLSPETLSAMKEADEGKLTEISMDGLAAMFHEDD